MRKENEWLKSITAKDLLYLAMGAAVLWNGFSEADAVTAVEVAGIKQRLDRQEGKIDRLLIEMGGSK